MAALNKETLTRTYDSITENLSRCRLYLATLARTQLEQLRDSSKTVTFEDLEPNQQDLRIFNTLKLLSSRDKEQLRISESGLSVSIEDTNLRVLFHPRITAKNPDAKLILKTAQLVYPTLRINFELQTSLPTHTALNSENKDFPLLVLPYPKYSRLDEKVLESLETLPPMQLQPYRSDEAMKISRSDFQAYQAQHRK